MVVDLEMSIYDQLVQEYGEFRMEQLFLDLLDNAGALATIVGNVLLGVVDSDPNDLASTASITKDLTMTLIERHASLEHALLWSTGPGMSAMLPMLVATSNLVAPMGNVNTAGMRHLMSVNASAMASRVQQQRRQYVGAQDVHETIVAREYDYNVLTAKYIRDMQKEWGDIAHEYDVQEMVKYLKKNQRQVHSFPTGSADTYSGGGTRSEKRAGDSVEHDLLYIRQVIGAQLQQHLRNYMDIREVSFGGRDSDSPLRALGFNSLKEMNQHIKSEYGDGWGLVYSIDIYKRLGIASRERSPFQEFIQEMQMTPKQASDYFRSGPCASPTQRRLHQIIPVAGILDCFTSVPPDLLCIVENFLPLPLDAPDWLEPVVDFDCDCDGEGYEDDDGYISEDTLINSYQIVKMVIQLISSISFISDLLMMIMVPMFIEDTFFIGTPGDPPDDDDIICAIIHLDYLLLLLFGGLIVLLAVRALCLAFWDIWNCAQDLRIRNEHNELVEAVLDVERMGRDNEIELRKQARNSLLNPAVMCYRDPDFYGKPPSFWLPPQAVPIMRGPPSDWYIRKDCSDTPPEQFFKPRVAYRGNEMSISSDINIDGSGGCGGGGGGGGDGDGEQPHPESTYLVQRHALRKAMRNVRSPSESTEQHVDEMYRKWYPEEPHHRAYSVNEISQLCNEIIGEPLPSLCKHDVRELEQCNHLPYMYFEHLSSFEEHLAMERQSNVPLVPHPVHM